MGRKAQTQWDFGELFAAQPAKKEPTTPAGPEQGRRVLTVSELTTQVKRLLERDIGLVWVTGEISNLRFQASGHLYFTLKDAGSQLGCVLFRGTPVEARDQLADGLKVILQGELTVYEPRGQYQLVVRRVELLGVGALQLAFEKLKQRLQAEGLFAPQRKRALPRCPQRIGVVTSPTGAALRDVLHVVRRRNPGLEVVLAPCLVQGEGAAAEIAAAVRLLNAWHTSAAGQGLDVILVTRGGGSLEDLWAFNEEVVARALAASEVPTVSAVGHEIDFTIADFVADLRAATPSAAAELLTEGVFASRVFVAEAPATLAGMVRRRLAREKALWDHTARRLHRLHPRRRLDEHLQRLDDLQSSLARELRRSFLGRRQAWESLRRRWHALRPLGIVRRHREAMLALQHRRLEAVRHGLELLRARWQRAVTGLRLLSPQSVLDRGYSITSDAATGRVLRDASEVRSGQALRSRLKRGEVVSVAR